MALFNAHGVHAPREDSPSPLRYHLTREMRDDDVQSV